MHLTGAYLGVFNGFRQDDRLDTDPVRKQFDFALNLDLAWVFGSNVRGGAQLQGGTGGGELGLQGPELVVTDLYLKIDFDFAKSDALRGGEVTLGAFDTPFGQQVAYLTNNGAAGRNPLLLNSLFYSAFGGIAGTLNTVGVMGTLEGEVGDVTVALTNGTDQSAVNADGNMEVVISAGTDFGQDGFRSTASFIASDDTNPSGTSGFGAELTGVLGDVRIAVGDALQFAGYLGYMNFGDADDLTEDGVTVWLAQAQFDSGPWRWGVRLSGWLPSDRDGNGVGVSDALFNPGIAAPRGGVQVFVDQEVRRFQVGGGWTFLPKVALRGEFIWDDYLRPTFGSSSDVFGFVLAMSGAS